MVNRLQKVLEDTNVKLGDVATAILGKSARAMLEAMLAGQTDPAVLADLARGRLKAKRAELEQALVGVFKPHHRFLLAELLTHIDTLDEAITRVSHEIAIHMQEAEPVAQEQTDKQALCEQHCDHSSSKPALTWEQAIVLLCTIPGISRRAAEGILAEIGLDMSRFPISMGIWHPGQACVQATTRVLANGSLARRARATPGCASCWWKPPMLRLIPRTPTCRLSSTVWLPGEARRKP